MGSWSLGKEKMRRKKKYLLGSMTYQSILGPVVALTIVQTYPELPRPATSFSQAGWGCISQMSGVLTRDLHFC